MTEQGYDAGRGQASAATVRLARPADADAIASVLHAAFLPYAPLYTEAAFEATVLSPALVRQRMTEGPVWVAEADVGIVGTVSALLRGPALYVRGMAVAPAAQRRRIGDRLLHQAERFGIDSGATLLELRTTPFLTAACRLYERHGFRRVDGNESLCGTPLFAMEKALRVPR